MNYLTFLFLLASNLVGNSMAAIFPQKQKGWGTATSLGNKMVFPFQDGSAKDVALLGNKGANLCEMTKMKLPVPPGFVISTETCLHFFDSKEFPADLKRQYEEAVRELEKSTGNGFGSKDGNSIPLLLSIRSGAAVSMPGMMDTCLNLGMNDEVMQSLSKVTQNHRFALDTQRRFLQMYGSVVLGNDEKLYENILKNFRENQNVQHDSELNIQSLEGVINDFKSITNVSDNPWIQLQSAIEAVFKSWYTPRAITYRNIHGIPHNLGTAVVVQAMVYGNMNDKSGSGVAFTRNPATGENVFYGEYLSNAEGEDVVAGIRNPVNLDELKRDQPNCYSSLLKIEKSLESHFRDMQDLEFTIENGTLYILQTRSGKRTAKAATKIAVDMVTENLISQREALLRVNPEQLAFFLHKTIDPAFTGEVAIKSGKFLGQGLAASAGAATGKTYL